MPEPRYETYSSPPPWWKTLEQDPWYITGAKAVLGEREVEEMRKGHVEPYIQALAPLLFMGRGGKLPMPEMPGMLEPFPMGSVVPKGRIPMPPEAPFVDPLSMPPKMRWPNPLAGSKKMTPEEHGAFIDHLKNQLGPGSVPHKVLDRPWEPFDYEGLGYAPRPPDMPMPPKGNFLDSALDDPIVNEYLAKLGVDPDLVQIPPPYVGPGVGEVTPATPLPPVADPFSVSDVETIHTLGLKTPPRSTAENKQDWENFVQKFMSGGGQSGDMHEMPGGTHFGGQEPTYHATQDYSEEFAPREEKNARFMSNQQPTPPPEIDFSRYY